MHGVVTDQMPLLHHAEHQLGVGLDQMLQYKKSTRHLLLLQNIQYLCHIAVFISGIKGQIDDLVRVTVAVTCVEIIAVILCDKLHWSVKRRLSVIGSTLAVPTVCLLGGRGVDGANHQPKGRKKRHCAQIFDVFVVHGILPFCLLHLYFLTRSSMQTRKFLPMTLFFVKKGDRGHMNPLSKCTYHFLLKINLLTLSHPNCRTRQCFLVGCIYPPLRRRYTNVDFLPSTQRHFHR